MSLRNTQLLFKTSLLLALLYGQKAIAVPFGIFDPRSMAMGGAGVASASGEYASFYNPAMLASYTQVKEKADNESFTVPTVSVRASKALETLFKQRKRDYEHRLNTSITTYNNNQSIENAQAVVGSINELLGTLQEVANNVFLFDANAALAVGVPSKHQGGAFFISLRGVGDGQLSVPTSDLELLDKYQQELDAVAAGETPGSVHPDLYTGGNLIDPSSSVLSEVNARAITIREFGLSMSKQFRLFGTDIAIGISPKIMEITTYEYHRDINSKQIDKDGLKDDDWLPNLDVGIFKKFHPQWQAGLVVKNLIARELPTSSGDHISFKPQWRAGLAHLTPTITYTVDIDLLANEGVYQGNSAQYILAGMEIKDDSLRYRLGYRDTISHNGPREAGIFSAGFGMKIRAFYFDLAYSENHQQRAGGLMLGFNF